MKKESLHINEADFDKFLEGITKLDIYHLPLQKPSLSPKVFQLFFKIAYYCGLRLTETLRLVKEDFDFENKILTVKNIGSSRIKPQHTSIPPNLEEELKQFLSNLQNKEKLFKIHRATVWRYSQQIGQITDLKFFKSYTTKKKFEGVFAEIFRKSLKQKLLREGVDENLVKLKLRERSYVNYEGKILSDLIDFEKNIPKKNTGIIILLDALGTKGIWKNNNPDKILRRWEDFTTSFNMFFSDSFKDKDIEFSFRAFSDTIIITTTSQKLSLEDLVIKTAEALIPPFTIAISLDIFLRGCISVGTFYTSEKMLIGQAIDEASQYYTLPEWIGISAAPSTHFILEQMMLKKNYKNVLKSFFKKYDIPLKNQIEKNGWALNWQNHKNKSHEHLFNYTENAKLTLEEIIQKKLRESVDVNVAFKWRNTMNFLNSY